MTATTPHAELARIIALAHNERDAATAIIAAGWRPLPTRSELNAIRRTDGLMMDGSQAYRHLGSGFIDELITAGYARQDDPELSGSPPAGWVRTSDVMTAVDAAYEGWRSTRESWTEIGLTDAIKSAVEHLATRAEENDGS